MSLSSFSQEYLPRVEQELRRALPIPDSPVAPFYQMMCYHLGWVDDHFAPIQATTGKRLRPLFCLLACQATGGNPDQALPAAAAIEMIHHFSLIHDDIEDNSPLRRHRPTLWRVWGQPQAVNTGDGMFLLARLTLYRLTEQDVPDDRLLTAARRLDEACLSLCEGQYLDLSFESRTDVTVDEYMRMISGKTAALLAYATETGALLAPAQPDVVEHYRCFGHNLGLAFQSHDDILGLWGQAEVTGKSAVSDILKKKKSLPVVHALGQGDARLREMYQRETIEPDAVPVVMDALQAAGSRRYAQERARDYYHRALAELDATGIENEAQAALRELAAFLIERDH